MAEHVGPYRTGRLRVWLHTPAAVLAAAVSLYLLAQFLVVGMRTPFGWDEAIYLSQVAGHGPVAWFDAPRARGITLLVAPIAVLTTSVVAIRLWMTVVSAVLLVTSLRPWRRIRSDLSVPLAIVAMLALWVTQFYGAEIMPNLYVAFAAVAATGFVIRLSAAWSRAALAGLVLNTAWMALLRPSDAVWFWAGITVALAGLVLGRHVALRPAIVTIALGAAGIALGAAEWVIEAFVRFGGLNERLHAAASQNSGTLTFSLGDFARSINGPLLCRPCARHPINWLALSWWFVLPPLVVAAMAAAWRRRDIVPVMVPVVAAVFSAAGYLLTIPYAAPRFLLPAYALTIVVASQGALVFWRRLRPLRQARVLRALALLLATVFVAEQIYVAHHHAAGRMAEARGIARTVAEVKRLAVAPPCLIAGPVDFRIPFASGCQNDYDGLSLISGAPEPSGPDTLGDRKDDLLLLAALSNSPVRVNVVIAVPNGRRAPARLSQLHWQPHAARGTAVTLWLPPRNHT